jgi:hypothetical protein
LVPATGILLSGLLLRYFADRPDTHDAEAYPNSHYRDRPALRLGSFLAKAGAAIATFGFGGAAGLEGPSLYIGRSLGHGCLADCVGWASRMRGSRRFWSLARPPASAPCSRRRRGDGAACFVIPGLMAAAAAYVVAGGRTLSEHQRPSRRA